MFYKDKDGQDQGQEKSQDKGQEKGFGFGGKKFDGGAAFDTIAQVLSDALGVAEGAKREVEAVIRTQLEKLILAMNIATREELDVLRRQVAALEEDTALLKEKLFGTQHADAAQDYAHDANAEGESAVDDAAKSQNKGQNKGDDKGENQS